MFASCFLRPHVIRRASSLIAIALAAAAPVTMPHAARAQATVPNALAAVEGNVQQNILNNVAARTYQTQIASSQLTSFAIGSQILGLSIRLDSGGSAPPTDLTFSSYQVTLSQATNQIGSMGYTFSNTFANNIGANAATVYNSSLILKASSYTTGTTPSAFGPTINFSSGYTYQGGDLVITIRHSGSGGTFQPNLDATSDTSQGYGTAIVGQFATGQNATTATSTGTATVLRLNNTSTAPEPATLPLLGTGLVTGLGMVGIKRRRK